jgi:hypothetical protein
VVGNWQPESKHSRLRLGRRPLSETVGHGAVVRRPLKEVTSVASFAAVAPRRLNEVTKDTTALSPDTLCPEIIRSRCGQGWFELQSVVLRATLAGPVVEALKPRQWPGRNLPRKESNGEGLHGLTGLLYAHSPAPQLKGAQVAHPLTLRRAQAVLTRTSRLSPPPFSALGEFRRRRETSKGRAFYICDLMLPRNTPSSPVAIGGGERERSPLMI